MQQLNLHKSHDGLRQLIPRRIFVALSNYRRFNMLLASALLALLPFAAAQTSTLCNPTEQSCPADPGFNQATTIYNFQQTGIDDTWDVLGSPDKISQDSGGLHFTIDAAGQAPTITTKRMLSPL